MKIKLAQEKVKFYFTFFFPLYMFIYKIYVVKTSKHNEKLKETVKKLEATIEKLETTVGKFKAELREGRFLTIRYAFFQITVPESHSFKLQVENRLLEAMLKEHDATSKTRKKTELEAKVKELAEMIKTNIFHAVFKTFFNLSESEVETLCVVLQSRNSEIKAMLGHEDVLISLNEV